MLPQTVIPAKAKRRAARRSPESPDAKTNGAGYEAVSAFACRGFPFHGGRHFPTLALREILE